MLTNLIFAPLFSLLVSLAATMLIIKYAKRLGILDDPRKNKHPKVIHTKPIPRGGGVIFAVSIIAASIVFLPLDKHLIGILIGLLILGVMGFLDDKYNLNPYLRLIIGFIAAAMPIAAGIGIAYITNPLGGVIDLSHPRIGFELFGHMRSIWVVSDIMALIWITFLMNAMNMGAKGIDGQLSGVVVLASLTIALFSLKFSADITQWPIIILALIVTGAYLGFLPFHIFPQKIMPGYGGGIIAGYMLAVLSILSTAKVGTLITVLAIPIIDTLYAIVRRLAGGKSPVWGDRGHLHHILLDKGVSKRNIAFIYWGITLIMGMFAYSLNTTYKFYVIILLVVVFSTFLIWINSSKSLKS